MRLAAILLAATLPLAIAAHAQTPHAQTSHPPIPAADPATPPPIPLQLNKLENLTQGGPGCRVFLVAKNPDPHEISQLQLDLVMFGTDGIIARRVALDLGPLPPRKTAVRLFDLPGEPCAKIGRILVNDVLACAESGQTLPPIAERQACLDRLEVSSRAKAELTK